jgi:5-methylcytosine-specific restriction endonuclease McrA
MEQTLVLNATYEPLRVVPWQKAITLLFQDKVEVLAVHDREVRGVSIRLRLPSVLRLLRHIRVKRLAQTPFSRGNVYARDGHRCQYCGREFAPAQLTFDHVVPVARGGKKEWENIVTCCIPCNRKKGNHLPDEVGMRLTRTPRRPHLPSVLTLTLGRSPTPASWRHFLHWDVTWSEP